MSSALSSGKTIALPFFGGEKFVCGTSRSGGMGVVWQLVPINPAFPVMALKMCLVTADPNVLEHEARAWISLGKSENIARAFSFGYLGNQPAILSEWVDDDLATRKAKGLSPGAVILTVQGILRGLLYAHQEHGLIHKDIKPNNILLDANGNPKITDFGFSDYNGTHLSWGTAPHILPSNDGGDLSSGVHGGTPYFMAPELFRRMAPSVTTDIYSLGVTLFIWLTGEHPYLSEGGRRDETPDEILAGAFGRYGPEADPLSRLVLLAIDLDGSRRPSSYQDLLSFSGFSLGKIPIENANESVERAIATTELAIALRRQGRVRDAFAAVAKNLSQDPSSTILLNTHANLLRTEGRNREAVEVLEKAVGILRSNEYIEGLGPYPDPVLNLSLFLITRGDFEAAHLILRELRDVLMDRSPTLIASAWEFAWVSLYSGDPLSASRLLLQYFSHTLLNEHALRCFCLSSFLSDDCSGLVERFMESFSRSLPGDPKLLQYFCLLASFTGYRPSDRLMNHVRESTICEGLRQCGRASNGQSNLFEIPMALNSVKVILRSIDFDLTGGKNFALP